MTKIDEIEIPLYHVELVRDRSIRYRKCHLLEDAAAIAHDVLDRSPVEKVMVMHMNSAAEMVGAEIVAVGQLERCNVSMAEIFRGALIAAVPRIVMAHNHPSGPTTPSPQDLSLTQAVLASGRLLGIELYDHIVVSPDGTHTSIYNYTLEQARNSPISKETIEAARKYIDRMFLPPSQDFLKLKL